MTKLHSQCIKINWQGNLHFGSEGQISSLVLIHGSVVRNDIRYWLHCHHFPHVHFTQWDATSGRWIYKCAVGKAGKGHCVPSKCQDTSNYPLHNVTSQKTRILNISAMEASNVPSIWLSDLTQQSDRHPCSNCCTFTSSKNRRQRRYQLKCCITMTISLLWMSWWQNQMGCFTYWMRLVRATIPQTSYLVGTRKIVYQYLRFSSSSSYL